MKTRKQRNINLRYLPKRLTARDKKKQFKMLLKSKKLYRKCKYYTRKSVKSFQSKTEFILSLDLEYNKQSQSKKSISNNQIDK